jgi:hypothetical protein
LRITHFSETTKDRNLIFGMGGDANVKLCIQHFLSPGYDPGAWAIMHLICLVTLIINIYGLGWGSRSHFFKTDSPAGWGWAPGIKNAECTTSHWHLHPYQILSFYLLANVKLCIQHLLSPELSPTLLGNLF